MIKIIWYIINSRYNVDTHPLPPPKKKRKEKPRKIGFKILPLIKTQRKIRFSDKVQMKNIIVSVESQSRNQFRGSTLYSTVY